MLTPSVSSSTVFDNEQQSQTFLTPTSHFERTLSQSMNDLTSK
jgi:hypothetical protein